MITIKNWLLVVLTQSQKWLPRHRGVTFWWYRCKENSHFSVRGREVKNPLNLSDVMNGWSLLLKVVATPFVSWQLTILRNATLFSSAWQRKWIKFLPTNFIMHQSKFFKFILLKLFPLNDQNWCIISQEFQWKATRTC